MNHSTFKNFTDASTFAKELAKTNQKHFVKHEGDDWNVYHENTHEVIAENISTDTISRLNLNLKNITTIHTSD